METVYYGETARTLYDRGEEHRNALREKNMESPLWEHHQGEHQGEEPAFEMGALCSPLVGQCKEARLIVDNGAKKLMNRKGEWWQNLPPRPQ